MSKAPLIVRLLAWLFTAPLVVLGVGFVFHTSFDPTVFGKYSTGYFLFLCFWWLLLTPGVYLLARFLFRTHRLELPSGRVLLIGPSFKILVALVVGWGLVSLVRVGVHKAMGEGVTTPQRSDVYHPYLQNTPKPNLHHLAINRWGFRGRAIEREKLAGTMRIFAFGGSTVFSGPLSLEQTWPERLGERLAVRHPDLEFEIQNVAAEWHCSQHSLIKLLTQVQAFDPDVLIVYHGINDLGRSLVPDLFGEGHYRPDYGHYLGPVSNLVRPDETTLPFLRLRLGYWFSDFLCHKVRVEGPEGGGLHGLDMAFFPKAEARAVDDWPSLGAFRRNLRDFVLVARAKGYDVVLASQPSLYRANLTEQERELLWTPISHQQDGWYPSVESMVAGMQRFNEASRQLAEAEGVPFVDLAAHVPKTLDYLWDDCHYTAKACGLIAELIDEGIAEAKVIEARSVSK